MDGDYRGSRSSGSWPPPPPWAHWSGWGWNQPGSQGRGPAPDANLRIGDAERSEMIETLSRHFAEGRLDEDEMRERVEKATGAKTRADLSGLLNDLPDLHETPVAGPGGGPVTTCFRGRHRFLRLLLVAFVVVSLAAWASAPWHVPWVLFLILGFFLWRSSRFRHHHHRHDDRGRSWPRQSTMV